MFNASSHQTHMQMADGELLDVRMVDGGIRMHYIVVQEDLE